MIVDFISIVHQVWIEDCLNFLLEYVTMFIVWKTDQNDICRNEADAWRWVETEIPGGLAQAMVWSWSRYQDPWQYPFNIWIKNRIWWPSKEIRTTMHIIAKYCKQYNQLIWNKGALNLNKRLWRWSGHWTEIECRSSNWMYSQFCGRFCMEIYIIW